MLRDKRTHTISGHTWVGVGSFFVYVAILWPQNSYIWPILLCLVSWSPKVANIFPMEWRYLSIDIFLMDYPHAVSITERTRSVNIWRKDIGSPIPWRSGDMWIQLKNLNHCCQAVVSLWNAVEEKPLVRSFWTALKSNYSWTQKVEISDARGFFCRKLHRNYWSNFRPKKRVSLGAASTILLYSTFMRLMDLSMTWLHMMRSRSLSRGPTVVSVITLPWLYQPCARVLYTDVRLCSIRDIYG